MIGKFIVYESVIRDRYVAAEVVGETPEFWKIVRMRRGYDKAQTPYEDHTRISKLKLKLVASFDSLERAQEYARAVTNAFEKLNESYAEERAALFKYWKV